MTALPKLLLVGSSSGVSGVPTYIRQLCEALRHEANITVVSDGLGDGYTFTKSLGLPYHAVSGLARGQGLGGLRRGYTGLKKVVEESQSDIVWANSFVPILLSRFLAHQGYVRKLVVTSHGAPFGAGRRALPAFIGKQIETAFLKYGPAQDMIFVSDRDKRLYDAFAGPMHRTWYVPNVSDLKPPPMVDNGNRPRLVMTSRVAWQKNPQAAARIHAALPEGWQMVMAGPGTQDRSFQDSLRALMPESRWNDLSFSGVLSRNALGELLVRSDLHLMTSRYEGFPLGALEAFETGLPLAMTDVGGTQAIMQAHPMASLIDAEKPKEAAGMIQEIITRFRQDRMGNSQHIRLACAEAFGFPRWKQDMQKLFTTRLTADLTKQ